MPQGPSASPERGSVVVAIGNELLQGHTQDSNTHFLTQRLFALGYPAQRVHILADVHEEIVRWVRSEVDEAPACIFVCGGLGPTPDDRTLEALSAALDRPLRLDEGAAHHIQLRLDWLHQIGRIQSNEMSEANRRMAMLPEGAVVLENSTGMAPGLAIPFGDNGQLFVLPGVPRELRTIFDEQIAPKYLGDGSPSTVEEVHYRMAVEAEFFRLLMRVEREFQDVSVGSYPQPERGRLIIRLSGRNPARVAEAAALVRAEGPGALRD